MIILFCWTEAVWNFSYHYYFLLSDLHSLTKTDLTWSRTGFSNWFILMARIAGLGVCYNLSSFWFLSPKFIIVGLDPFIFKLSDNMLVPSY